MDFIPWNKHEVMTLKKKDIRKSSSRAPPARGDLFEFWSCADCAHGCTTDHGPLFTVASDIHIDQPPCRLPKLFYLNCLQREAGWRMTCMSRDLRRPALTRQGFGVVSRQRYAENKVVI